jgi:hypothetical protein
MVRPLSNDTEGSAASHLVLRGIEVEFGTEHTDAFHCDLQPHLRTDYVTVMLTELRTLARA